MLPRRSFPPIINSRLWPTTIMSQQVLLRCFLLVLLLMVLFPERSDGFAATMDFEEINCRTMTTNVNDNDDNISGSSGVKVPRNIDLPDAFSSTSSSTSNTNENDGTKEPFKQRQQQKQQPQQQNQKINTLDAFVQMRSGLGSSTPKGVFSNVVFWSADGELYESPSGNMLARIEGVETSHAIRLESDVVRIFSRKLVWFLHPETHEIMTEYEGKPVQPIRYDAQVFDMKRGQSSEDSLPNNDLATILPFVVRSTRLVPCMPITPRRGGSNDLLMFQVPLFIDIEIPILSNSIPTTNTTTTVDRTTTRRYQAWEFYDYYLDLQEHQKTPVLSWMRQGSTPPFCVTGNGVMHARGHRVASFEELPQTTQDYVNQNYPLFRGPPQDMQEVDRLLGTNV